MCRSSNTTTLPNILIIEELQCLFYLQIGGLSSLCGHLFLEYLAYIYSLNAFKLLRLIKSSDLDFNHYFMSCNTGNVARVSKTIL